MNKTVFICYNCWYDYCDVFKDVEKVFDDEVKALVWKEEVKPTEMHWRDYESKELE